MKLSQAAPLFNYLKELSLSPTKLAEFKSDPEAALQNANLSEEHKAVLRTRDPLAIKSALSPNIFATETVVVVVVIADEVTNDAVVIDEAGRAVHETSHTPVEADLINA
jgi:hypothetical protein